MKVEASSILKRMAWMMIVVTATFIANGGASAYDPMHVGSTSHSSTSDFTVHDAARGRDIPIKIYLPASTNPAPVILFSHGLGGSRAGSAFLGEHWAARGFVAVFLQHPGSDDSVWKGRPMTDRMVSMKQAASLENFLLRVRDVSAVLDQLELWNQNKTNLLAGRMDMKRVGMSGHSFGAVTTQAVSGESLPAGGQKFMDPRIKAALILSPSAPRAANASKAFGAVKIPWMLMTGTKDLAPIGNADMESRLAVYPTLPDVPKFELVLNNAEHSVFTDRPLPGDHEPRNPNHHRVILSLSTAFWDAYLSGNSEALAWLKGQGPRQVMEPEDRWQFSVK
jgi:predicted dienelactone hydrolase